MKKALFTLISTLFLFVSASAQTTHSKGAKMKTAPVLTNLTAEQLLAIIDTSDDDLIKKISLADLISMLNLATGNLTEEEVQDIIANALLVNPEFLYDDISGTIVFTDASVDTNDFPTAATLVNNILTITIPNQSNVVVDLSGIVGAPELPDGDLGDILKSGNALTIDDGAVGNAKLSNGSVNGAKVQDNSLTGDDIASFAISNSELSENAVRPSNLIDSNAPVEGKVLQAGANNEFTWAEPASGSGTSGIVASGTAALTSNALTVINHGLGYSPNITRISVTAFRPFAPDGASNSDLVVTDVNSTSFSVRTGAFTGDLTATWRIFGTDGTTPIDGGEIVTAIDTELGQTDWKSAGGSDPNITYNDVTGLRAYTGSYTANQIVVLLGPQSGYFQYDASDTITADDGGIVFVDANGNRLKRLTGTIAETRWFVPNPDPNVDNYENIMNFLDVAAASDFKSWIWSGLYKTTQAIDLTGRVATSSPNLKFQFVSGSGVWSDTAETNIIDTRNKNIPNLILMGEGQIKQLSETPTLTPNDKSAIFLAGGDYSGLKILGLEIETRQSYNAIKLYSQAVGEVQENIEIAYVKIPHSGRMGFETVNNNDVEEEFRFKNINIHHVEFDSIGMVEEGIPISFSGYGTGGNVSYNTAKRFDGMFVEFGGYQDVDVNYNQIEPIFDGGHFVSSTSTRDNRNVRFYGNTSKGAVYGSLLTNSTNYSFTNNKIESPITINNGTNIRFFNDEWEGGLFGTIVLNGVNDSITIDKSRLKSKIVNSPSIIVNTDTNTNVTIKDSEIETRGAIVFNTNSTTFQPTFERTVVNNNGTITKLGFDQLTAPEIKTALESLSGTDRLDASAIKNLPSESSGATATATNTDVLTIVNGSVIDVSSNTGGTTLGPELIDNNSFNLGANWSRSADVFTNVFVGGDFGGLRQDLSLEIGERFVTTVRASNYTQGAARLYYGTSEITANVDYDAGGSASDVNVIDADGTYTFNGVFGQLHGNGGDFQIFAWSGFGGSLDLISIKKVIDIPAVFQPNIDSPQDGEVLEYDTTEGWRNVSASVGGGSSPNVDTYANYLATPSNYTTGQYFLTIPNPTANLSDGIEISSADSPYTLGSEPYIKVIGNSDVVILPNPDLTEAAGIQYRIKHYTPNAEALLQIPIEYADGLTQYHKLSTPNKDALLEYDDSKGVWNNTGYYDIYDFSIYPNEYPDSAGSLDSPTATNLPTFASNPHTVTADATDPNDVLLSVVDPTISTSYQLLRYNLPTPAPSGHTIRIQYEFKADTDMSVGITGSGPYAGVYDMETGDNTWRPKEITIVSDGTESRCYFLFRSLTGTGTSQVFYRKIKVSFEAP